jgi:hypothetical protein
VHHHRHQQHADGDAESLAEARPLLGAEEVAEPRIMPS